MDKYTEQYKKLFLDNLYDTNSPSLQEGVESSSISEEGKEVIYLKKNHFMNDHICGKGTQLIIEREE